MLSHVTNSKKPSLLVPVHQARSAEGNPIKRIIGLGLGGRSRSFSSPEKRYAKRRNREKHGAYLALLPETGGAPRMSQR